MSEGSRGHTDRLAQREGGRAGNGTGPRWKQEHEEIDSWDGGRMREVCFASLGVKKVSKAWKGQSANKGLDRQGNQQKHYV